MTDPVGIIILEADESFDQLGRKLDAAMIGLRAGRHRVALLCPPDGEARLREWLPERFAPVEVMARTGWWRSPRLDTRLVAFLPAAVGYSWPRCDLMPEGDGLVRPWIPPLIPVNIAGPMVFEPAPRGMKQPLLVRPGAAAQPLKPNDRKWQTLVATTALDPERTLRLSFLAISSSSWLCDLSFKDEKVALRGLRCKLPRFLISRILVAGFGHLV